MDYETHHENNMYNGIHYGNAITSKSLSVYIIKNIISQLVLKWSNVFQITFSLSTPIGMVVRLCADL